MFKRIVKLDQTFLKALKKSYVKIMKISHGVGYFEVRRKSAKLIKKAFDPLKVEIRGSEHLPKDQKIIFIYNHLRNHPYFTVDNTFQITLDSHFISSKILYKYYKNPGTRVVRFSLPEEDEHRRYYNKFNFIRVFSKDFTPSGFTKKQIRATNEEFYNKAANELKNNTNLVFSPEGSSYYTDESPGTFRKGIFKLAASFKEQPLFVPIVLVNFDKLPSKDSFKCEIKPPFRLTEFGVDSPYSNKMEEAIEKIQCKYEQWINELKKDNINFEREIVVLKQKIEQKENKKDLVVFYGSSTLRLWENMALDFPDWNTLNLGFGGAFIHSMEHYFEVLFEGLKPKSIILYLGGNDLTLGYSAQKIGAAIADLVKKIHYKFPKANIYSIAIKPSIERAEQLKKICSINSLVQNLSTSFSYFQQIEFYEHLIEKKEIKKEYLLQDGLHLNSKGYELLSSLVRKKLQQ